MIPLYEELLELARFMPYKIRTPVINQRPVLSIVAFKETINWEELKVEIVFSIVVADAFHILL